MGACLIHINSAKPFGATAKCRHFCSKSKCGLSYEIKISKSVVAPSISKKAGLSPALIILATRFFN
jgi:hypothetical protein